jgi:hypothetical protein
MGKVFSKGYDAALAHDASPHLQCAREKRRITNMAIGHGAALRVRGM